ncbi:MAG: biopolymer transporter ExbD [Candidatus Riflebacteria bacterium]|nr:biopolymer transporter ExbD [Candidatus Riflebacteria bacterium]
MSLRRKTNKVVVSADLTTCSDIIFTLLLFYILTQGYVVQVPLELPEIVSGKHVDSSVSQRIEVTASAAILFNDVLLSSNWEGDLKEKISRLPASYSSSILIVANHNAPAGVVIKIMDRLREMGIYRLAFAGIPLRSER